MADKVKVQILIEQVDNGYSLHVVDQRSWKETRTVHFSPQDAITALRKVIGDIEGNVLAITAGEGGGNVTDPGDLPF